MFHTYLCKTVMLWICQQHTTTHPFWKESNLLASVQCLFGKLETYLEQKCLPHFFIPEYNLLKDIPSHVLCEAKLKAGHIKQNVPDFLPPNMKELVEFFTSTLFAFGRLGFHHFGGLWWNSLTLISVNGPYLANAHCISTLSVDIFFIENYLMLSLTSMKELSNALFKSSSTCPKAFQTLQIWFFCLPWRVSQDIDHIWSYWIWNICPYRLLGEIPSAKWHDNYPMRPLFCHEKVPKIARLWCDYLVLDLRNQWF